MAKSHKIILMITAVALGLMLALSTLNLFTGSATEAITPTATNYFTGGDVELNENGAKISGEVDKILTVGVKNKLAIDDMKIELGSATNVEELKLVLTYDSFLVNGNKNTDGKFDKEIVNEFVLADPSSDITVSVENNVVKVNGSAKAGNYYKIRKVDKAIAKIEFKATLSTPNSSASIVIKSIDQKVSDTEHKYLQSFVTDGEGKLTPALPIVALDADMFVRGADGKYSMVAYANEDYTLSYKVYSVLGNVSTSDLYPTVENANVTIPQNDKRENKDELHFKTDCNATESFNISNKEGVIESYTVNVVKKLDKDDPSYNNNAPVYNLTDTEALEAFTAELEKQYIKDGKFVALGTEIEIPSMEDFVIDDRTPYDSLTKKMYYASRTESSSSSLNITLNNVGDYYFYVLFTDSEDEGMEKESFLDTNDDGEVVFGSNKNAIFYFTIEEDTEIVITAPKQGAGYKGSKYTASKFDITSSNCDITYKLEYTDKENPTDSDWVEIKKLSEVEEGESVNGYSYETLEKINYNGEYTFTPDKVGTYRITVNVTSKMSFMNNSQSTLIKINEPAKVITPSAYSWIKDNVWSVVFLSVGTLCLVGIIALLFVKPKEKADGEE